MKPMLWKKPYMVAPSAAVAPAWKPDARHGTPVVTVTPGFNVFVTAYISPVLAPTSASSNHTFLLSAEV